MTSAHLVAPMAVESSGGVKSVKQMSRPIVLPVTDVDLWTGSLDLSADLRFNPSASDGYRVLRVTGGRESGVDVERVKSNRDPTGVVERHGTSLEREAHRALPPAERVVAFHRRWTAKEAWLEAVRTGLRAPLDSCSVDFSAAGPLRLLEIVTAPPRLAGAHYGQ